ncbi:hypothetical protein [Chthoniobacter flavus]|nr:hypothetical protein [Chthoniobacter flavus]
MKTVVSIICAAMLFGGISCFAGGIRIGDTPAARIAKDASIPGKGKQGECLPFAIALQKKLQAAGVPAQVVVYGYETGGVPTVGTDGEISAQPVGGAAARASHAAVVYEDRGRTYMMDNQSWTPRWIHNASPVQMAQQFSGINYSVKMARVMNGVDGQPKLPMASAPRQIAAN